MSKKITIVNNEIIISDEFPSADGDRYVLKKGLSCLSCSFHFQTPIGNLCDIMPKKVKEMCESNREACMAWKKVNDENFEKDVWT